jgi:phosphate transport system permease protein
MNPQLAVPGNPARPGPRREETAGPSRPKSAALAPRGLRAGQLADRLFRYLMLACGLSVIAVVGLIVFELFQGSRMAINRFGFKFFIGSQWDPVSGEFGALPFVYGTVVSSLLALVLAVPLGLGVAVFVTEICPRPLRAAVSFASELLAAIPSVIYGLWAIFVLVPLLRQYVEPWLMSHLGWSGLFEGPPYGIGMLAAGVILAIMIVPIISSITREVMAAVPRHQREAALALGATRWEMIRMGVLRNARAGIVGAAILGLGRALGETMAVTMVIGNRPEIAKSLLAPGYTLASVIANEFSEATDDLYLSALFEVGLALFLVTILVNALARLLVWSVTRGTPARAHAQ